VFLALAGVAGISCAGAAGLYLHTHGRRAM
jgi:hypothetical protein